MVHVEGNATTGYAGNAPVTVDLPRPAERRTSHRPWCCDCKRTLDADQLDDAGRCARCAKAAASRAAAEAARAERAEEIARLEAAAAAEVKAAARKQHAVLRRPAPATELPTEGKQGKPTSRRSAPAATSTSGTTGRAPVAGPSTHREKSSTAAPAGDAPRQAAAEAPPATTSPAPADPQPDDSVADLIQRAATVREPLVRHLYDAAISSLTALRLALDEHEPARPAERTTTASSAPSPALEAPTSAGPREGETRARRTTRRSATATTGKAVDERAIVTEYQAGDTAPTIAARHSIRPKRVRDIVQRHGISLRDDRTQHSGGRNRLELPADLVDTLRRRYVDDHVSVDTLASEHGVHRRIITRTLLDAGVTMRPAAHLAHTPLTDAQRTDAIDRYRGGESLAVIARSYHVAVRTVRDVLIAAGVDIRAKGASTRNTERMASLGVTAREIKQWAVDAGLADGITSGIVPGALIDAYAAAHPDQSTTSTTNPTGDTAA